RDHGSFGTLVLSARRGLHGRFPRGHRASAGDRLGPHTALGRAGGRGRMTQIIAIRHGPVEEEGICYGRLEVATRIPQDALEELLFALRATLAEQKVRLWSSPAIRCRR